MNHSARRSYFSCYTKYRHLQDISRVVKRGGSVLITEYAPIIMVFAISGQARKNIGVGTPHRTLCCTVLSRDAV